MNTTTPTYNRYEILSDSGEDNETPPKIRPPPPIIMRGRPTNTKAFMDKLKEYAGDKFHLKYTFENTNVYVHESATRDRVIQELRKTNTYTSQENKTYGFVLRGLDCDTNTEEIKQELENKSLKIHNVFKMTTKERALYLVITPAATKLEHLVSEIKYLLYVRIYWERHQNNKIIIECHWCHAWGHATANCMLSPRCLKCAGPHETRQCADQKTPLVIKCINCDGNHTANNIECPRYQSKLKQITQRRKTTIPPHPTTWTHLYQPRSRGSN